MPRGVSPLGFPFPFLGRRSLWTHPHPRSPHPGPAAVDRAVHTNQQLLPLLKGPRRLSHFPGSCQKEETPAGGVDGRGGVVSYARGCRRTGTGCLSALVLRAALTPSAPFRVSGPLERLSGKHPSWFGLSGWEKLKAALSLVLQKKLTCPVAFPPRDPPVVLTCTAAPRVWPSSPSRVSL